ncbi:MAG: hypothetical protein PHE59_03105 [Patescibacteria group bacterium]|nr:hypothetical protein [Patescibacteria group bacterium]MDD5164620.1 hypothetical protein [Patescibacteria group bacterium]MDD5534538.1 hypothetical protein [Patescibacteria group bacterium]
MEVFMKYWVFRPIYYNQVSRRLYPRQNRKLKKYLRNSPVFSKLLAYATLNGIKVEKGCSRNPNCDWSACTSISTVKVYNVNDVYRFKRQEEGVYSFAHEIGHIEFHRNKPTPKCWDEMEKIEDPPLSFKEKLEAWIKKDSDKSCGCFWDEWMGWIYGYNALRSAGVPINEKKYWRIALNCIPQHEVCPLWPFGCEKFNAIQTLEKKYREKLK